MTLGHVTGIASPREAMTSAEGIESHPGVPPTNGTRLHGILIRRQESLST